MILLDTHTLVWLAEGNEQLGTIALNEIDQALADRQLAVATISFWEIAMLIEKGRLEFDIQLDIWRQGLLRNGLLEISLTGSTAIRAGQLQDFHGDPADRMIVATAIEQSAILITADKKILNWTRLHQKLNARK